MHKKVDTKAAEKAAGEVKPKTSRSYGGGSTRKSDPTTKPAPKRTPKSAPDPAPKGKKNLEKTYDRPLEGSPNAIENNLDDQTYEALQKLKSELPEGTPKKIAPKKTKATTVKAETTPPAETKVEPKVETAKTEEPQAKVEVKNTETPAPEVQPNAEKTTKKRKTTPKATEQGTLNFEEPKVKPTVPTAVKKATEELNSLKTNLLNKLGKKIKLTDADFEKPSEIVNAFCNKKGVKHSTETLEDVYKYLKAQQKILTDPVEIERTQSSELHLLTKMKGSTTNFLKAKEIDGKIDESLNTLIEKHFGKNWSNTDFDEKTISELNSGIKNAIRKNAIRLTGSNVHPAETFPLALTLSGLKQGDKVLKHIDNAEEKLLTEFQEHIFKKFNITDESQIKKMDFETQKAILEESKNFLNKKVEAPIKKIEILNDKAGEIIEKLGLSKKSPSSKMFKTTKENLANFKKNMNEQLSDMEKEIIEHLQLQGIVKQNSLDTFKTHLIQNKMGIEGFDNLNDLKIEDLEKPEVKKLITKAYRQMAIKYHPDKNPGDKVAEANFKVISEAYEFMGLK